MKTLKLRIKDKHTDQLNRISGSVNFVWNYINALCFEHLKRTGKYFSAYDLNQYTKGSGEYLGLHSQTLQAINETHAKASEAVHFLYFCIVSSVCELVLIRARINIR